MKVKIKPCLFPKPYLNGEYPIYIRIYFNSKSSYVKTGYSIPSGAWNEEGSETWESMPSLTKKLKETLSGEEIELFKTKQKGIILLPNASKINSEIRGAISKLEEIQNEMNVRKEDISAELIKSRFDNKDKNENARKDFLQYIQLVADRKQQARQIRTSEKYNVMLRKLKIFRKDKPLPLDQLTTAFLNDFQLYLQKDGLHQNYIHVNLKALKTIIQQEAIKGDKIMSPDKNPFIFFKMPKVLPSMKERLDIKEIKKIEALKIPEADIHFHIRNIFLFSLYNAGIRIGDLLLLKWINLKDGRLQYRMSKTDSERSIKLLPQALRILKIYEVKKGKDTDFIFPFLDNKAEFAKLITSEDFKKASPDLMTLLFDKVESRITIVNKGLKDIAKMAKIDKRITTHVARHSFADIARKQDISIYDISKMLGHSDISVTQGYINSLDYKSMDEAMGSVFSKKKPQK